ncbi:MAG: peptide chain release factor N(5)-glutamine methyltransferase [Clostridiales bacterium]|nr:peptide chain release factor N(5)-glutamine methyltransferase [Clostridiales bacterium]
MSNEENRNNSKPKKNYTYVGGQAVMEGVMMRGKRSMATAVRDPEGKIQVESERFEPAEKQSKFKRLPFIRGIVSFVSSLIVGNRVLMRSADVALPEEELTTKAEKWLVEKHKIDINAMLDVVATGLGILLALVIFIWLPQFLTGLMGLEKNAPGWQGLWFNLAEGGVRMAIFVLYILIIGAIPSLRRVFMCHGAEHKTITCYEEGKELTIDNVRNCSRVHDRCGTTFLFLVMLVSILVFSLANVVAVKWIYTDIDWVNSAIRICFKLLLLPVVAGVSYELLRLLSKTDNKLLAVFKAPGLLLQRITTREPEDGMIECAIVAFQTVLAMDNDLTIAEKRFATPCKMTELLENTKTRFRNNGIEEDEAEWIFSIKLSIPKSAVASEERILKSSQVKDILAVVDERLTGRPLWYIIGDTSFCGYTIKVDERVLIPRSETEELAMLVVNAAEEGNKILDLCTGSGALAIAIDRELEKDGRRVEVTAADISAGALELAQTNAILNGAHIRFVESDMLTRIRERYNIIVCNPPYIPSKMIETLQREVKDFEPRIALDGGDDGLDFYRTIAENVNKNLARGGILIMEVGQGQAQEVASLFKYCDYAMIIKDGYGVDRFVKIVI